MNPLKQATNGISKLARLRFGLRFARRGDAAMRRADWIGAIVDYRRALDWMPWREDLKIQIGNCLKEYGDLGGAIAAYRSVSARGNRAEALIQIADVERREGFTTQAFFTAADTREWPDSDAAWSGIIMPAALPGRIKLDSIEPRRWLGPLGQVGIVRRRAGSAYASIKLDQVGAMSIEREGLMEPLFAGIVAIRGRVLSLRQVSEVEVLIGEGADAVRIAGAPTRQIRLEGSPLKLYVFNLWLDSAPLPRGRHWLSVRESGKAEPAGLFVTIADLAEPNRFASSNGFIPSPAEATSSSIDYVKNLPALARPAQRTMLDWEVRSLLAIRADQLGDLSASLPALQRLRVLFADAHLTVLVQPAVRAIVEASGIADTVLTISLPYDHQTERRYLDPAEELRVRAELASRNFDLAIDLSPGSETRNLLLLSGADYLVGFDPHRFAFLDFGISIRSRDKVNQLERNSHTVNVLALVEALALTVTAADRVVPRAAPANAALESVGLAGGTYVAIHTGARHAINKWSLAKFEQLVNALIARSDYHIAIFCDDGDTPQLPSGNPRLRLMGRLDVDVFDAILSNAVLLIANDSGPKHLAAIRGTPTISLQVGRLNWNEWGQEGRGTILSKRVPCTGCGLNDLDLCGLDAICIRSITVEDVLVAAANYIKIAA